jgi:mannose-6-phosphate isomerase-like protein (cupin superfamily)
MRVISGAGEFSVAPADDWVEHLRVPDISCGTYSLAAGSTDEQSPHAEDEIYICTRGQATLWTPAATAAVGPGTVLFVPAGEEHRFTDITADLALIVVFGPAYGSRQAEDTR